MELKVADHSVELVKAIVSWPLVVFLLAVFFILLFRKSVMRLLENIGGRANKLSLYGMSIELLSVQSAPLELDPMIAILRQPDLIPSSGSDALADLAVALQGGRETQYIIIDISPGNWLTSRLYLFSALLPLITNLSRLIFVESSRVPNEFIAQAAPEDVLFSLEQQFNWLLPNLEQACSNSGFQYGFRTAWTPQMLSTIAAAFIGLIRNGGPDNPDFVEIRPKIYEKAQWVTRQNVSTLLKTSLVTDYVRDDGTMSQTILGARVLSLNHPLVPLVDMQVRFTCLLDRVKMLDSLAEQVVKSTQNS